MLAASILVVARTDAFLIHTAEATIRFGLSSRADPRRVADAARHGPAALRQRGMVSGPEAAELDRALAAQGIRTDVGRPADLPTRVMPLGAVIAAFAASGAVPQGVVAVTAAEALWLPPGCAPTMGERALRLFVARLPEQIPLSAYGRLLSSRHGLAIAGDLPDPDRARTVREIAMPTTEATTWSWAGGEVVQPGRIDSAVPSGRLSVTLARPLLPHPFA